MTDLLTRVQSTLAERYAVEREIGRGGMATVFLAEELHPRRKVAIKVLTPDVATHLLGQRFLREVNLASTLSHPHIVPVLLRVSRSIEGLDPPFVYGVVKLWQARIAAALGDREGAVRLLRQAEAEGRRFDSEEKLTVDFQELSDYQPFRDWLAPRPTR